MDLKTRTLIEIRENYNSKDLEMIRQDLSDLTFAINYLTDALHVGKVALKDWQRHLEILLVKFSFHTNSMIPVSEGVKTRTHIKENTITFPDLASLYVIARAQIENYLILYYLNFDEVPQERALFRSLLYEYNGLIRRQKFDAGTPESVNKLQEEKKEIEGLRQEIKSNSYFSGLPSERRRNLLKGYAVELTLEQMIESRGIDNTQFYTIWKLYSNYVHTEYLSLIQIKDYLAQPKSRIDAIAATLNNSIYVGCLLLHDLRSAFYSAEISFNSLEVVLRTRMEAYTELALQYFGPKE